MRQITIISIIVLVFQPLASGQSVQHALRVKGHVTRQSYCYGDADVFTVPMNLDIQVTNISKQRYFLTSDVAPVAAHVAGSVEQAQNGVYVAEWYPTRYPKDTVESHTSLSLAPGRSTVLHIAYAVVARFKTSPSIPGTISPGKYVLQLDLKTENGFAESAQDDDTNGRVVSLKTEPIVFEIPQGVKPEQCKSGTK